MAAFFVFGRALIQFIRCRVETSFSREVEKYSECTERYPEVEVRVLEREREDDTEQRGNFAERTTENKSCLDAARVLVLDRTTHMLPAEDKRKGKENDGDRGEDQSNERHVPKE